VHVIVGNRFFDLVKGQSHIQRGFLGRQLIGAHLVH
jgi:hypothetical protein